VGLLLLFVLHGLGGVRLPSSIVRGQEERAAGRE
jgi:hypothetical protein